MNVKDFKKIVIKDIKGGSIQLDKSSQLKMIGYNISTNGLSLILNDVFNEYVAGISNDIMSTWKIQLAKENIIERLSDLQPFLSKRDYLSICLMVGTKVDKWISEAVYEELFETASNLKKILYD
jgi:hypothetical protein